jgi:hypothetical protein
MNSLLKIKYNFVHQKSLSMNTKYDGPADRLPVHPLYHQGIPYGNHENTASFGYAGVEDGYISIADVGFYHAVPGYMDGKKTFQRGTSLRAGLGGRYQAVGGGYEGVGYLKMAYSGIALRFPARSRGGLLIQQFTLHGVRVQAGGILAADKAVKVPRYRRKPGVPALHGGLLGSPFKVVTVGTGNADAFREG